MKKRVIFYGVKTFPSKGGSDRVAEALVKQLKDEFDITLYCYKDPAAKNNVSGVKVVEFTEWMKGAPGSFIYFFISALYLLFEKNVDLIHVHKTDGSFFIPLLRLKSKVVATSQEAPYKRDKWNWFIKLYFKFVERLFVYTSNAVTSVSEPLARYYEGKYHRKVYFIPNGINKVDPQHYDFKKAATFIPKNANWDDEYIFFAARRIMSTKGCHTMLKALNKINYKGQVFIAGELDHSGEYINQLKELSKGLNVHMLGYVDTLPALLALVSKSKLFVFPSETEGMSLMLLEVASTGKPIVASDIPENTQVFTPDEVLYFKDKDSNDLAEKISFALENPDKMQNFGLACQAKVHSEYLMTKIARTYANVYGQLL